VSAPPKIIPLLVPIEEKDELKALARKKGQIVHWNQKAHEWELHPKKDKEVPTDFSKYYHPGYPKKEVKFQVLSCKQETYFKIKKELPQGKGNSFWESNIHRAIWRGTSLPQELKTHGPKKHSLEELYSFLLNSGKPAKKPQEPRKLATSRGPISPNEFPKQALTILVIAPKHLHNQIELPTTSTITLLTLEEINELFPPITQTKGRNDTNPLVKNRIDHIHFLDYPEANHQTRIAQRITNLLKEVPSIHWKLPEPSISPLYFYPALPILERKYKRPLPLEHYEAILNAFKIKTTKGPLGILQWEPSPNDEKLRSCLKLPS